MSFRPGVTTYSLIGITIARKLDNPDHEPWFYPDPTYTRDSVLGGSQTYLDLGALQYPPLSFRASCLSPEDRSTLIGALFTTTTLSNSRGHSGTVTIVKARPINSGDNSRWWIDLSFELRL